MKMERALAKFICETKFEDLPKETISTVRLQCVALFGATIAATNAAGCAEVAGYVRSLGGNEEATVLMHGGKVPAQMAAFANAVMGRAHDIDDHISPGIHIGAAVIPAALATAELIGGCTGKEFITAIAIGTEIALRLNLKDTDFDGFDPTGILAVYSSAAAASKLMKLDEEQTLNALALAYNRSGGSYQSNADGSLAVRIIEGWVSQMGIECARLAKIGINGPHNFLEGVYSYFHLYAKEKLDRSYVAHDLGKKWHVSNLNFKKYPCCGLNQGSTQLIMDMMAQHAFAAEDVEKIEIRLPPFSYKLVGKFELGNNPKVNAQFSVGYCVANAVVKREITLVQFEAGEIEKPEVRDFLAKHVEVIDDPGLVRGHYSSDIAVKLKNGTEFKGGIDIPPGTPAYPMTEEEHRKRFYDCVAFSGLKWFGDEKRDLLFAALQKIEELENVTKIIPMFLP